MELNPHIIQTSPKGRPYRISKIETDTQYPEKWIGGVQKKCYLITIKFLDTNEFEEFKLDYNEKISK